MAKTPKPMQRGIADLTKYSVTALESLAAGHEEPAFRKAAEAELQARTKKPTNKAPAPTKPAPNA